jgi:hypothetical protein
MSKFYGAWGKTALLVFFLLAALLLLAELAVPIYAKFPIAQTFGFFAWYAFASCMALIVLCWLLGLIIRRPEDYYDR